MTSERLESYLTLPYRVEVTPDEEGGYNTAIRELKGCVAFGETVEEAYSALEEVKRVWLETALARGWRIPVPRRADYSGEFRVRLPKSLHAELARLAEAEGTSLNQLVVAFLSEGAERLRLGGSAFVGTRAAATALSSRPAPQSGYARSPIASESSTTYDLADEV